MLRDTDEGQALARQADDLDALVHAYEEGIVREA
jgi:hypothetical protein